MSPHNAPAVSYFAGRPDWLGWGLALLGLITIAMLIAWYALTRTADWRFVATAFVAVLAVAAAGAGWQQVPNGVLAWDQQAWSWTSGRSFHAALQSGNAIEVCGAPVVVADFQQCLLVQITAVTGAVSWLWLEQRSFSGRWLDMRRAIYSRPRNVLTAMEPASDVYDRTV